MSGSYPHTKRTESASAMAMNKYGGRSYRHTSQDPAMSSMSSGRRADPITSTSHQREVGGIQNLLSQLRENVRTLEYLVIRAKSVTSPGEEAKVTEQIENYTESSRAKMEEARKRIKHMYPNGKKPKTPEEIMCKNQQLSLARQLFGVAQSFQAMQLNLKSNVMEKLKRQYKIVRPEAGNREVDDYLMNAAQYNNDQNNVFQQAAMSGRPQALNAFQEAKSQQVQLQGLNQRIEEMLNLFQEMQILIDTQGEQINEINVNSEAVVTNMNGASTEMTKAIKSRIRARRRYRCFALIGVIILAIAATLIALKVMKVI